jgi:hypothetical protein
VRRRAGTLEEATEHFATMPDAHLALARCVREMAKLSVLPPAQKLQWCVKRVSQW